MHSLVMFICNKKIIVFVILVLLYGCSNNTTNKTSSSSNITYIYGDKISSSFNILEEYTKAFYSRKGENIYIRISHDNGMPSGMGVITIFLVGKLEREHAVDVLIVKSAFLLDYRFHPHVVLERLNVKNATQKDFLRKKQISLINLSYKNKKELIKIILKNIKLQKLHSLKKLRNIDDVWTKRAMKRFFPEIYQGDRNE